jgi:hypothetical protein
MFRNQDRLFTSAERNLPEVKMVEWNGETTDEEIERFLKATVPNHSKWESYQEFRSKIKYRDDLIFGLQACLAAIQNERNLLKHKYEVPNKD